MAKHFSKSVEYLYTFCKLNNLAASYNALNHEWILQRDGQLANREIARFKKLLRSIGYEVISVKTCCPVSSELVARKSATLCVQFYKLCDEIKNATNCKYVGYEVYMKYYESKAHGSKTDTDNASKRIENAVEEAKTMVEEVKHIEPETKPEEPLPSCPIENNEEAKEKMVNMDYANIENLCKSVGFSTDVTLDEIASIMGFIRSLKVGKSVSCRKVDGMDVKTGYFTVETKNAVFCVTDFVADGVGVSKFVDIIDNEEVVEINHLIQIS